MNIYETIPKVMESIGAVTKDKKNTSGQTFMYRGIDDVMNALSPAMTQFKLFVVPEVLEQLREERTSKTGTSLIYSVCKIKYTFYAEDGSNISAVVIGEAFDSGDKATNKAMSVAFKYACFQVFCIPTEEMKDPDSETHELSKGNKTPKPVNKEPKLELLTEIDANTIKALCKKRGLDPMVVFKNVPVEQLTKEQYVEALKKLNPIKNKEKP